MSLIIYFTLKFEPANLMKSLILQQIHKHILGWESSQSFIYCVNGLPTYLEYINLYFFSCKPKAIKNIGLIAREQFWNEWIS